MGLNVRRRTVLREEVLMRCKKCKKVYPYGSNFCSDCGEALISEKTTVYANFGKSGITSLTYKLPDGTTINTRRGTTIPIANGVSYTIPNSKKS